MITARDLVQGTSTGHSFIPVTITGAAQSPSSYTTRWPQNLTITQLARLLIERETPKPGDVQDKARKMSPSMPGQHLHHNIQIVADPQPTRVTPWAKLSSPKSATCHIVQMWINSDFSGHKYSSWLMKGVSLDMTGQHSQLQRKSLAWKHYPHVAGMFLSPCQEATITRIYLASIGSEESSCCSSII